jgi:MerR family transcriptional regulator, light-induced transcriptional regulator
MMTTSVATRRSRPTARLPVRTLVHALVDGDDDRAMDLVQTRLTECGSRTSVFADLLHPAQVEVGNLWYRGGVSFRDELRVAAMLRGIVCRLGPTPARRPVRPGSTCVIAIPHDDPHDLGLLMLTHALQDHGWSTVTLGAAGGLSDLAEHVRGVWPRLFCFSAAVLPPLPQVERLVAAVRSARIPVLVGGAAFVRRPDLHQHLGADGVGTDVRVGVVLAHHLAGR